jgi:hypothetical protein
MTPAVHAVCILLISATFPASNAKAQQVGLAKTVQEQGDRWILLSTDRDFSRNRGRNRPEDETRCSAERWVWWIRVERLAS